MYMVFWYINKEISKHYLRRKNGLFRVLEIDGAMRSNKSRIPCNVLNQQKTLKACNEPRAMHQ